MQMLVPGLESRLNVDSDFRSLIFFSVSGIRNLGLVGIPLPVAILHSTVEGPRLIP